VLVLAGFGGWFLARRSLSPVASMAEHARRIGAEDLSERLPVENPGDELGHALKDQMMLKTKPAKEVVIKVPNAIGTLNAIARVLADKGINILAVNAWVEGAQAVIRLVTDDSVRVLDALRGQHYDVRAADVLVTEPPHKPGMLHRITERLAGAEIDIHHLYATASSSQAQCLLVFATANNDRAMVLLNAAAVAP
jgi:hypothetical protein